MMFILYWPHQQTHTQQQQQKTYKDPLHFEIG